MGDTPSSPQYDDMKPRMRGTVIIKNILLYVSMFHMLEKIYELDFRPCTLLCEGCFEISRWAAKHTVKERRLTLSAENYENFSKC